MKTGPVERAGRLDSRRVGADLTDPPAPLPPADRTRRNCHGPRQTHSPCTCCPLLFSKETMRRQWGVSCSCRSRERMQKAAPPARVLPGEGSRSANRAAAHLHALSTARVFLHPPGAPGETDQSCGGQKCGNSTSAQVPERASRQGGPLGRKTDRTTLAGTLRVEFAAVSAENATRMVLRPDPCRVTGLFAASGTAHLAQVTSLLHELAGGWSAR